MNKRALGWIFFAAPAAALLFPGIMPRLYFDSLPLCLLHACTGFFCFSCGGTRALWLISRGKPVESLSMNLFVLPCIIMFFYASAAVLINGYSGRNILPEVRFNPRVFLVLLAAGLAFMVLRNIPCFPFNMLAPAR